MTHQEIFDTVAIHLLTQGKRAGFYGIPEGEMFNCLYRANDGCKCAVGCLIPDDKYDPKMEGGSVDKYEVKVVLHKSGFDEDMLPFLGSLQDIHDLEYGCHPLDPKMDYDPVEEPNWKEVFRNRLRQFATSRKLDPAILDQVS